MHWLKIKFTCILILPFLFCIFLRRGWSSAFARGLNIWFEWIWFTVPELDSKTTPLPHSYPLSKTSFWDIYPFVTRKPVDNIYRLLFVELLEVMTQWIRGQEKTLPEHLIRFMAHIVLFIRSTQQRYNVTRNRSSNVQYSLKM